PRRRARAPHRRRDGLATGPSSTRSATADDDAGHAWPTAEPPFLPRWDVTLLAHRLRALPAVRRRPRLPPARAWAGRPPPARGLLRVLRQSPRRPRGLQ